MKVREVSSYENKIRRRVTEERETQLIREKLFIRPTAVIWKKKLQKKPILYYHIYVKFNTVRDNY